MEGAVSPQDREWMTRALALARRGELGTSPNPRVGCVLVRDGHLLAEGWHAQVGQAHAEAAALQSMATPEDARGATAYVTLEPCSHHGRTPPCADALIAAGISRCVVAMQDPHPKVAGRGLDRLRQAGVDVAVMDNDPEARWLNRRFFSGMERGRPWVVLKCAISADGFMDPPRHAGQTGSLAITRPELRTLTHRWRAEEDAILVGAGTLLSDNPRLDVRDATGPDPQRIILDVQGRTYADAAVFHEEGGAWVIGGPSDLPSGSRSIPPQEGRDAFAVALEALQEAEARSVLVEGGRDTLMRIVNLGLWDELRLCRSPRNTGGGLPAPVFPLGQATLRGQHPFGEDVVEYWVNSSSARWVGAHPPPTLSVAFP